MCLLRELLFGINTVWACVHPYDPKTRRGISERLKVTDSCSSDDENYEGIILPYMLEPAAEAIERNPNGH